MLKPSQVQEVFEALSKVDFANLPSELTQTLAQCYGVGLRMIFDKKWEHKTVSHQNPKDMTNKLMDLYLYGENAYYR